MDIILQGYITKIAAVVLIGIGLVKVYKGQVEAGLGIITAGFGLFGLRRAVDNVQTQVIEKVKAVEAKVNEAVKLEKEGPCK